MKMLIVGEPTAGTTRLVVQALQIVAGTTVQVIPPAGYAVEALRAGRYEGSFFVVNEEVLVQLDGNAFGQAQPNTLLSVIWDTLRLRSDIPLHVAIDASTSWALTGLDVLALLQSGVNGVWGVGTRLLDDASEWPQHLRRISDNQRHSAYLFGRPADELYRFYSSVGSPWWPTTEEQEGSARSLQEIGDQYPRYGFLLALGLALLTPNDFAPLFEDVRKPKIKDVASFLQGLGDRTGYDLNEESTRKVLGVLVRGWEERFPGFDRDNPKGYPDWARRDGFPNSIPLIRDVGIRDCGSALHAALQSLEFDELWERNQHLGPPGVRVYTTPPRRYRRTS